jgi:hypothetical protein
MTRSSSALAPVGELTRPAPVSLGTLEARSGAQLVAGAAELAGTLRDVIERQQLYVTLSGRKFVRCEGWTTLSTMLGVTPHLVELREEDGIFIARVELRRLNDGMVIGSAEAECGSPDEVDKNGKPTWASRPRYARRAMAQTRAVSRVCRQCFSWVMTLAGFEATPAEEYEPVIVAGDTPRERVSSARSPEASDDPLISKAQQKRFFAVAKSHGWSDEQIRALLQSEGLSRSSSIRRAEYEALISRLEQGPSEVSEADEEQPF